MGAVVLICLPGARATAAPAEPTLEQVRAVTEKYRDVKVALAEGYVPDPTGMCMTADMIGRSLGNRLLPLVDQFHVVL